jgi:para-aminobenzoate synthetase component 1
MLQRLEPSTAVYSNFTRESYMAAVERVIEYIRAGDIFQANLSQQLHAEWPGTPLELFAQVRRLNPAPFCGLLQHEDTAIISASPERFLKVDADGRVETRPIKGTRRRQRSPIADLYVGAELAASEKDRAENVMIVDLLRNDISRNCARGSVKVTGLCEIERFETVLHLVSTVEGRLAAGRDIWHLLTGCIPGGSITGAPKIRAMEIIAELEQVVRGAWCGSLFALGPQGAFDSSILIRTFTWADGWVQFPVGGGVVADSSPLDEYRETLHKASGMIRALQRPPKDA